MAGWFAAELALLLLAGAVRADTFCFEAAADPSDRSAQFRLAVDLPVLVPGETGVEALYRQRSFWHVDDDDPFPVESNFRPEVFLRHEEGPWRIQASFVHESDGLEGELSRGWNRWVATAGRRMDSGRIRVTA